MFDTQYLMQEDKAFTPWVPCVAEAWSNVVSEVGEKPASNNFCLKA